MKKIFWLILTIIYSKTAEIEDSNIKKAELLDKSETCSKKNDCILEETAEIEDSNIEKAELLDKSEPCIKKYDSEKRKKIEKMYPGLYENRQENIRFRKNLRSSCENDPKRNDNVKFFKGEIKSQPDGDFIDNILTKWKGNYKLLEEHHGYIQWLFPNKEPGMNYLSQPLQLHELDKLKSDSESVEKLLKSFELMLDFYGMELNKKPVGFKRSENYKKRYQNLIRNRHNFLRISRILKCLADFDLEEYQIEWIKFLIEESFVNQELSDLDRSITQFYVHTIKNDEKRHEIIKQIELKIIQFILNEKI
ncbi:unnamed protein product [Brachionus calyciflorus]|uniref:Opioid growth factor receptor (OGFr) conserved domain-containing protein n=1 Tax=Brachionus calyciflorus TaxID=104777 RepID=A0A813QGG2_9BILA|nr:unnamed protein product [Brachionus calyciflorus]